MDTNNEILDAIEILAGKKISENITKVLTGVCKSVNINKNTCVMDSNGVSSTVQFYGSPPEVNELYRIFVPSNDMSRSFIIIPPRFTVNPNLLDNWYFANPVNQRGQTEYTGKVYGVDRWSSLSNIVTMVVGDDGLTVSSTAESGAVEICQYFESYIKAGTILTLSAIVSKTEASQNGILRVKVYGGGADLQTNLPARAMDHELVSVTNAARADVIGCVMRISNGDGYTVHAIKLELGPTQTLAHLENGSWVLNEIPNYGEQLARCQRYCRVYKAGEYLPALGYPETDGWYMQASLYIGGMRTTPVNNIGSGIDCSVSNIDGSDPIDKKIKNWGIVGGTVQRLRISSSSGNDTKGPFPYNIMPKKDIIFSADL